MNNHHYAEDHMDEDQAPANNFTAKLIRGLNFLVAEAEHSNLIVPARIISAARSDIIHWTMNTGQPHKELSHQVVDHSGVFMAIDLVAKYASIKDPQLRKQILDSLEEIKKSRGTVPRR